MKIGFYTLGCKVNQFETQSLETAFSARGYEIGDFNKICDVYIINTCTITATGDRKSRVAVSKARTQNPAAVVGVCGCYSADNPDAVLALGADIVSDNKSHSDFVERVDMLAREGENASPIRVFSGTKDFELLPAGSPGNRTRALLKVQDGCNNYCAYCIIPTVRGRPRSLPPELAEEEAARLAAEGYREIVLCGIELSSYGIDLPNGTLEELIERVCAAAPGARIRLGSLEPRTITEDFARRLSSIPNLCPHFHLSLQSGSDETLGRMRRRYTTRRYKESLETLRKVFENAAITTDLICGFPGETEGEFEATLRFIDECDFARVHIFPYSKRKGTLAAQMPNQLTNAQKRERCARAAKTCQNGTQRYLEAQVGKVLRVLFEREKNGVMRGYSENYLEVNVPALPQTHGEIRKVKITSLRDGVLWGEVLL